MSFLPETRELPQELPRPAGPELLVGAASPLWAYFSGAAATGLAWWWMTRMAPQNLEAMFALMSPRTAAETAAEAAAPVVETVVQAALSPEPAAEPPPVVGGEAAPISPLAAQVPPEPRTIEAPPEPEPAPARTRRTPPGPPVADA